LLTWISGNHWDYAKGVPEIGFTGWSEAGGIEVAAAMKEYCQAHPDEFDWIGSYLAPLGTMTWAGEIEKLKNCDYVGSFVNPLGYLLNGFRDRGYGATFIDIGTAPSFQGFFADLCGWGRLDGTLTGSVSATWNEQTPIVDLAKELLRRYRPGQAEEIMRASHSYVGSCQQVVSILDILRAVVEEVGAENFDGQAFYNAAVKYQTSGSMWEGYPKWGFSETKRYLVDHIRVYKFDAETESLVRVSDWLPATG
jgi:hypothetical protein